ncbi:hypothetical protein DITRI_Ditri15bG0004200 [Diplodiscus trichospermus]
MEQKESNRRTGARKGVDKSAARSDTISILRKSAGCDYDDEFSQNPNNNNNTMSLDGRKSEDSGESIRSTLTRRDRRGCYKRSRKCAESWSDDTPTLIDDGHAWRKYGQKAIHQANYPRSYYRCTHKQDQNCPALKQVQQIEDDPPKFRTTYYGHHSCRNLFKASQLILDSTSDHDSSMRLISFANNNLTIKHDDPFLSSFTSVKQERKEDHMPISDITYNRSSSSVYLVSPELTTFESSADDQDVISRVVMDSVDFDKLLGQI